MRSHGATQDGAQRPGIPGSRLTRWLAIAAAVVGTTSVHLLNLGADTPQNLPDQIGLYVDEGYKTLSPRNLVLFGETRWYPEDRYPGWFHLSPITQGAFLLGFKLFGQSLESARVVSVLWLALLLIAFVLSVDGREPLAFVLCGILAFGFEHVLWVFSRVAILEMAGIALIYGTLLLLKRVNRSVVLVSVAFLLAGAVTVRGVKFNAAYVLVPALFGMVASVGIERWGWRPMLLFCGLCAFGGLVPVVSAKAGFDLPFGLASLGNKVDLFPLGDIIERFIGNSILKADPFLILLGSLAALWLLLHRPDGFVRNPYRCAVTSIALLGMMILALTGAGRTETNPAGASPLRYCVWLLPAYLLLVLEWWTAHRTDRQREIATGAWGNLSRVLAIGVLVLLLVQVAYLVVWALSTATPIATPHGWVFLAIVAAACAVALPVWMHRDTLLSASVLRNTLYTALIAWGCFNALKVAGYLLRPTWELRTIVARLEKAVPEEAIVAGDWAPLFTLGTPVRSLYMHPRYFNQPEDILESRPTHFLYCEIDNGFGDDGLAVKRVIEANGHVSLEAPVVQAEYTGRAVILYPLRYDIPSRAAGNPDLSTQAPNEDNEQE